MRPSVRAHADVMMMSRPTQPHFRSSGRSIRNCIGRSSPTDRRSRIRDDLLGARNPDVDRRFAFRPATRSVRRKLSCFRLPAPGARRPHSLRRPKLRIQRNPGSVRRWDCVFPLAATAVPGPPSTGMIQMLPRRSRSVPLTRRRDPSGNQAIRSTSNPAGVLRGRVKPSLMRRRCSELRKAAKASLFPSGDMAAEVTLFSLACAVTGVISGSFEGRIRCSSSQNADAAAIEAKRPNMAARLMPRERGPAAAASMPARRRSTSAADGRLAGSLANIANIREFSAGGISGRSRPGDSGSSCAIAYAVSTGESRRKGCTPVVNSYRITPSANTSVALVVSSPRVCSGLM